MTPSIQIVAVIAVVWFGIFVLGLSLCRAAGRRTPAPPARPRARLIASRDGRRGVVEILPAREETR